MQTIFRSPSSVRTLKRWLGGGAVVWNADRVLPKRKRRRINGRAQKWDIGQISPLVIGGGVGPIRPTFAKVGLGPTFEDQPL